MLRSLPIMHVLYFAACFGLLLDIRLGLIRKEACPHLWLALLLWLWTLVSVALTGGLLGHQAFQTMAYLLLSILVAQGVQSFRALRIVGFSILVMSLFLAVVAIVQARSPIQCILLVANMPGDVAGRPDGRPCEWASQCREDAEPGDDYLCERPGPFDTHSIGHGRVRYRGILADPNELALALVVALPLVMTLFGSRRSVARVLVAIAALAITFPVVVWTASRTGQLAFVAVIAVYILQKVGLRGLLATALLAAPVLALGGRSGEEAEQSSMERLDAWYAGFQMLKSSPIWGVGKSQFTEHHDITAHNTFILQSAELGIVGLVLWVAILYVGVKVVIVALRRYGTDPTGLACIWARALLASLTSIIVGINFLSLAYHPVVWIFLGLPGGYYLAVRRHDPEFRVELGKRDLLAVTGLAVVYCAGVKGYLLLRGF
ncbi:MAG TPA: O-antigen ligase family protein [Polyangia bacterium]